METDKICPNCETTFSSVGTRNRHMARKVCEKPGSRSQSTRNPQPPDPPSVLLKEDHEGLLLGHTCPYSKYNFFLLFAFHHQVFNVRYRICQLLKICNTEVYPPLSHCTIPGGISVCPTTDTDNVRLRVLLAAKSHGVSQISVPKTG